MTSPDRTILPVETPPAPRPVLRCRDLRKAFDGTTAVDGLSFEIAPGETYGLLGPNGAGKTTTILVVAGVLAADRGDVEVVGEPMTVRSVRAKRAIGYVPQETALYPELSGRENLRFFAGMYGLGRAAGRARVEEVLATVGLADRAGSAVKTYSGGMQRRLNIAVGLLHRPELLILDEPTVGVDPQSRNAILESIEQLSAAGMAVLYTTHYMEEAQRLCDRVGIIDRGRLVAEGTTRELTGLVGESDHVRLTAAGDLAAAAAALRELPSTRSATVGPDGIDVLDADARTALPALLATATGAGAVVRSVTVEEPDLEAVFLHLTGGRLRD
ncbi:ABC transporter ATP-binding protein [Cryptosporangium minutisporangium]|uniref:Linearmycin resistance ATP-binding protein LnrL n=1 Tax=Cryptosporangium minutisporangium TaxID=113569 RepID=A0ABP6SSN3_9ACTN